MATETDARYQAIKARDAAHDGKFFYSVQTTGVYCRPSCAARLARPENVDFHATTADAERAGYRPCKRCKPTEAPLAERRAATIAELCRFIEKSDETPSLETLAEHVGMSVFHVHRLFKSVTGLTPKAYAAAHRAGKMRRDLRSKKTVTEAIYAAGYNSPARFYEKSSDMLGMTPSRFKKGGERAEIRFAVGECSLGSILVASTDRGVCAIFLGDDPDALTRDLQKSFPNAELVGADRAFEKLVAQVVGLIEQPNIGTKLPLDVRGTAFQERVWKALQRIGPGRTTSYSELAEKIGAPSATRAVAQACASNMLAVAIPCHRVVRKDGDPSGYRWGVDRKRALLSREARS